MDFQVECPFCGMKFDLAIDTSIAAQQFTTDCEVCCRPFSVSVECEPGEVLSVSVDTVTRDWRRAKAFLRREMTNHA